MKKSSISVEPISTGVATYDTVNQTTRHICKLHHVSLASHPGALIRANGSLCKQTSPDRSKASPVFSPRSPTNPINYLGPLALYGPSAAANKATNHCSNSHVANPKFYRIKGGTKGESSGWPRCQKIMDHLIVVVRPGSRGESS